MTLIILNYLADQIATVEEAGQKNLAPMSHFVARFV
jgi:hypothetical protein